MQLITETVLSAKFETKTRLRSGEIASPAGSGSGMLLITRIVFELRTWSWPFVPSAA